METYIAILRGINVGGKNKIKMADLRENLSDLGFKNVETYIQSGNIIFDFDKKNPLELAKQIKSMIKSSFGFDVPVIVIEGEEFVKIWSENPFTKKEDFEIKHLHVTFLAEKPNSKLINEITDFDDSPNQLLMNEKVAYLICPNGYSKTKLTNDFFEKKLKTTATTRNFKTVTKIAELAKNRK